MKEIVCYTVEEVAEILKLYKKTVYGYIKSGKIKAVKIGRRYRITEDELHRLLNISEN